VKPTTARLLLGLVAAAAAISAVFVWSSDQRQGQIPQVPWSAPAVLGVCAVIMLLAAFALRPRLQRRPGAKPLHPLAAARVAVLSLAASRAGAVFAGLYVGYALVVARHLDSDYRRLELLISALAVLAAVLLIGASLLLERACRLPEPPEDEKDTQDPASRSRPRD